MVIDRHARRGITGAKEARSRGSRRVNLDRDRGRGADQAGRVSNGVGKAGRAGITGRRRKGDRTAA
jgi:hypothetical protein